MQGSMPPGVILQLEVSSATAPSTLAALWLARAGQRELIEDPGLLAGRLAELPIGCTAWDGERLRALRALGVSRIGELLRLPRAGMARRFGAAAVLELDIALTRQAAPRRAFVPRERFRERFDFETEVETVAYLQKALEPLIGRCARFLRERQAGVQTLELRLEHRTSPAHARAPGAREHHERAAPLDRCAVAEVVAARARGACPSMELVSGPLQPLSAVSLDVFARHGAPAGAAIRRRSSWSVCAPASAMRRCTGSVRSPSIGPRPPGSGFKSCVSMPCCAPAAARRRSLTEQAAARLVAG